jgi:hypothetical protein
MRNWTYALVIAVMLTGCSSLATSDVRAQLNNRIAAAAEISRLENDWVAAWNARNYAFMERILAPQFMLASSGGGQGTTLNNREGWLKNARSMAQLPFEAKVIDVVVAGNTAVATLEARWRRESFLTDTWVKRNGQWQVIFRHSAPRRSDDVRSTVRQ